MPSYIQQQTIKIAEIDNADPGSEPELAAQKYLELCNSTNQLCKIVASI